jgi:hypothetical protein
VEFLRFGSSIPGGYWGCCACCIIQNFKVDPDAKASIQLVSGDGGGPVGDKFAGPTYRDIFHQRLRSGTFDSRDMPNHAFIAILTDWQVKAGGVGSKWLKILKEAGFEFVRTVSNSVYDGQSLGGKSSGKGGHPNYIFMLVRNVGTGNVGDPFTPPKEWTDLPKVTPEAWEEISDPKRLAAEQYAVQKTVWDKIGPPKFLTEKQVVAAGAPVIYAGLRSEFPQETKASRDQKKAAKAPKAVADPFATSPAAPAAKVIG